MRQEGGERHPSRKTEPLPQRDLFLGVQTFAIRIRFNRTAVLDSEGMPGLLAELHTKGVLVVDVITQYPNAIVNTALLCQALFCEIDGRALRITPDGVDYIENLLNFS